MKLINLICALILFTVVYPWISVANAGGFTAVVEKLDNLEARIAELESSLAIEKSGIERENINTRINSLENRLNLSSKENDYENLEKTVARLSSRIESLESGYSSGTQLATSDGAKASPETLAEFRALISELREVISGANIENAAGQDGNTSLDRKPVISGLFKTLWEYDDYDGSDNENDFSVYYGRISIKGDMTENIGYQLQVDFARDSDDMLLDAFAFFHPTLWSKLTVGQFKSPYSTVNLRSASKQRFISKPLIASKISPKTRDIGLAFSMAGENYSTVMGVFNGVGQNQPDDNTYKNLAGRFEWDFSQSLQFSGNAYYGKTNSPDSLAEELTMYNGGAVYSQGNLSIEGEYGYYETENLSQGGYFIDAVYEYKTAGIIKSVSPGIRYDWYDPDYDITGDIQSRYSAGLMFKFSKFPNMHARVNYLVDDIENSTVQDKRILSEIQLTF